VFTLSLSKENILNFKQDKQCTYNVILSRCRELLFPWKSNKYYILRSVCVRTRACVRVCVGGGGGVLGPVGLYMYCACVASLIHHATRMRHIVTSFLTSVIPQYSSTLCHKQHNFRESVVGHKVCSDFLYNFFLKYF
jgi:hypothetical protein